MFDGSFVHARKNSMFSLIPWACPTYVNLVLSSLALYSLTSILSVHAVFFETALKFALSSVHIPPPFQSRDGDFVLLHIPSCFQHFSLFPALLSFSVHLFRLSSKSKRGKESCLYICVYNP
jgi:hypothetical protein